MQSQIHRRPVLPTVGVIAVVAVVAGAMVLGARPAVAAQSRVGLGQATSYAVLAGSTITNTGTTFIRGDVGVSPGSTTPGLTGGMVHDGAIHTADAAALRAKDDLTTAYHDAAGRSPEINQTGEDLGGKTLVPGVYAASSSMQLTGTVTLDAQGDPNAVFVFKAGSTLITASNSTVALTGGARACRVFWQVGSSATLGTGTQFVGSVLALTSITLGTGAVVRGQVLARNGQVALDSNTITRPTCTSAPPSTESPTETASPTSSPSDGGGGDDGDDNGGGDNDGGDNGGGDNGGGGDTPTVPVGHPETGRPSGSATWTWLVAGLACLTGAAAATGIVVRGPRRRRAGRHA